MNSRLSSLQDTVLHVSSPSSRGNRTFSDTNTATKWNNRSSNDMQCTFCHSSSHTLLNCPVRYCRWCNVKHPKHYGSDCSKHPRHGTSSSHRQQQFRSRPIAGSITPDVPTHVTHSEGTSASPSNNDLMDLMKRNQELMAQLMAGSMGTNDMTSTSGSKDHGDSWNRP